MKNLLVAQSGGPTAAINSTLLGVLAAAKENGDLNVFGAKFGIEGILKEDLIDLKKLTYKEEEKLKTTPSSVLGSCRYKLKNFEEYEEEYLKILNVFKKFNIGYFIYIGGNDSMDTADKISKYLKLKNINDVFVVGAPKTIDNDLEKTDHCPGFGSAAKYIATTFSELERDVKVYNKKAVTLVETMGRDSGFLTASSCLARQNGFCGPSLIYCCECDFFIAKFLKDIEEKFKEEKALLVAVSEGIKIKDAENLNFKDESKRDVFGHSQNAGVCKILEKVVGEHFGCKTRSIELNLMQRCCAHLASKVDLEEAFFVGKKAANLAISQQTGFMATIERKDCEEYKVSYGKTPLFEVANRVKKMPQDFITENGCDVSSKGVIYLKPLIEGEVELKYENGIPLFFNFSN